MKTGHAIVDEISTLNFKGVAIDHRWIGHPWLCNTTKGGKVKFNLLAAYVLAEICYFYSARVEKDPDGHVTRVTKRFDGEVMYQDYRVWSEKLGCEDWKLRDTISFLCENGLVKREVYPVTLRSGISTNNLAHIQPIPEKIKLMTFGEGLPKIQDTPPGAPKRPENSEGPSGESGTGDSEIHRAGPEFSGPNYSTTHTSPRRETQQPAEDDSLKNNVDEPPPSPASPPIGYSHLPAPEEQRLVTADDVLARLVAAGVAERMATKLLASEGAEACHAQLEALPYRKNVQSVAAFLVNAIRGNWALPPELTKTEAELEEDREAAEYAAAMRRQKAHDDALKRQFQDDFAAAEAYFDALPESDQADLVNEACARAPHLVREKRDADNNWTRTMRAEAVAVLMGKAPSMTPAAPLAESDTGPTSAAASIPAIFQAPPSLAPSAPQPQTAAVSIEKLDGMWRTLAEENRRKKDAEFLADLKGAGVEDPSEVMLTNARRKFIAGMLGKLYIPQEEEEVQERAG